MRQALLVGIDDYGGEKNLTTSVNDTKLLGELLSGTSPVKFSVTRRNRYKNVRELDDDLRAFFDRPVDVSLFYFSGHGDAGDNAKLLLNDFDVSKNGFDIHRLMHLANKSRARHRILILDCCYAGGLDQLYGKSIVELEQGVTILASCQSNEVALGEKSGLSLFTDYLLQGMRGEAADERGIVTMPAVFRFIEQSLQANQQRPVFRCNCSEFIDITRIDPLDAFNWQSNRIFREIQQNYSKCHATIIYSKKDYLILLDHWLKKAEKEVLFTSSGIVDVQAGEMGKLQEKIIQSSKDFKNRNPKRLHLGIVGTGVNKYIGALQLRSEVIDVALKFNSQIDRMSYNAFIVDEKQLIIRLKNQNGGLDNYAVSIENKSLALRLREWFLTLWHAETSQLMYFELKEYLRNATQEEDLMIDEVFNGDVRRYRTFQERLLQVD